MEERDWHGLWVGVGVDDVQEEWYAVQKCANWLVEREN